jgi:hypothetical protein
VPARRLEPDAHERHLFISVQDPAGESILGEMWPLPESPPDPLGVIATIWLPCTSSSELFAVTPDRDDWRRCKDSTGEAISS